MSVCGVSFSESVVLGVRVIVVNRIKFFVMLYFSGVSWGDLVGFVFGVSFCYLLVIRVFFFIIC